MGLASLSSLTLFLIESLLTYIYTVGATEAESTGRRVLSPLKRPLSEDDNTIEQDAGHANGQLLYNIAPLLSNIRGLGTDREASVHVPRHVFDAVSSVVDSLANDSLSRTPASDLGQTVPSPLTQRIIDYPPRPVHGPQRLDPESPEARVSKFMSANWLIEWPINAVVEYPSTSQSPNERVLHIFEVDPLSPVPPTANFVYSFGDPKGARKGVRCHQLTDVNNEMVMCKSSHSTCAILSVYHYEQALRNLCRPRREGLFT